MARLRSDLQNALEELLGSDYVYFQPPTTLQMHYPCIVYSLTQIPVRYADSNVYLARRCYQVTIIDKNPDSLFPDKMTRFDMCSFERGYTADNLNHFVFRLYY